MSAQDRQEQQKRVVASARTELVSAIALIASLPTNGSEMSVAAKEELERISSSAQSVEEGDILDLCKRTHEIFAGLPTNARELKQQNKHMYKYTYEKSENAVSLPQRVSDGVYAVKMHLLTLPTAQREMAERSRREKLA